MNSTEKQQTKKGQLLKSILFGSLLFYALSGLTSILNYAYYPIIARFVSTDVYGEIQFLTALFTQLAVGFVVLNILSIILTAKYTADHHRNAALSALTVTATTVILGIILAGTIILGLTKSSFGLESIVPVVVLGASLLLNVPFTIMLGRLQGEGKYALSGAVAVIAAFSKLIVSIVLISAGWGTSGAMAGIGIGLLIALIVAAVYEKRAASYREKIFLRTLRLKPLAALYVRKLTHLKSERFLAVTALVAMGILTILSTADVFISKLMLSPFEAGQYAAVATVAKTILYAATPLMWLALPPALSGLSAGMKSVRRYIHLTITLSVLLALAFSLNPAFITRSLLDINAGTFNGLLPLAASAMALFSVAFILVAVDLCKDNLKRAVRSSLLAVAVFIFTYILCFNSLEIMQGTLIAQTVSGFIAIISSLLGNTFYDKKN